MDISSPFRLPLYCMSMVTLMRGLAPARPNILLGALVRTHTVVECMQNGLTDAQLTADRGHSRAAERYMGRAHNNVLHSVIFQWWIQKF